jgi:diacylglycerol kinase (ATP)
MNLKIIINPRSRRKINCTLFDEKLKGIHYSIATTTRSGEALDVAREAVKENVSHIVAVGGDGTINEVINGMKGSQVSLGIIPIGGANDFANYLGIPIEVGKAMEVILDGDIRIIDLVQVNHRYFTTVGGIGFGTEVALKVNAVKDHTKWGKLIFQCLGSKIYQIYALSEILFHPELTNPF